MAITLTTKAGLKNYKYTAISQLKINVNKALIPKAVSLLSDNPESVNELKMLGRMGAEAPSAGAGSAHRKPHRGMEALERMTMASKSASVCQSFVGFDVCQSPVSRHVAITGSHEGSRNIGDPHPIVVGALGAVLSRLGVH